MNEYKIVFQDITSMLTRDLPSAVDGLQTQVNQLIVAGWRIQGGLATVQAGGSIYLMQALVR